MNLNSVNSLSKNQLPNSLKASGKILLTSEYFIMDGAPGIALPLKVGQAMKVSYKPSFEPHIIVKSYNQNHELWFSAKYEIWQFKIIESSSEERAQFIQKIFKSCRKYNPHFLYENSNVVIEHFLDFDPEWGLGSSSTLISNLARFARVNPFQILDETLGGSGFDIACSTANRPLVYIKSENGPIWDFINLDKWEFTDQLFFVYLGRKQSTVDGINYYKNLIKPEDKLDARYFLTEITDGLSKCTKYDEFVELLTKHEIFISEKLHMKRVGELKFADFEGLIKSCGAWNGDFILAASNKLDYPEILSYFKSKNLNVVIPFNELVKINQLQ